MPATPAPRLAARVLVLEGAVLLVATPFLLFPEVFVPGTLAALLILAITWAVAWRRFPVTPYNGALLLWTLMLGVAILVSADPDLSLPKATGLILGLAGWRGACLALDDARRLRWGGWLYILLAGGFVLLGVLGADWRVKLPGMAGALAWAPSAWLRLPGSPTEGVQLNQLAGTILLILPLSLSLALAGRPAGLSRRGRRLLLALSGALLLTLLLSQSRGGWLGGALGLFALAGLFTATMAPGPGRRRLALALLASALLVGALGLAVGPDAWRQVWDEPAQQTVVGDLSSLQFRQEVWRWGLEAAGDFPYTGLGLGAFRRAARRLFPLSVDPGYDFAHAHNIPLQVALDVGLPGLVAYGALLFLALALGWRAARRSAAWRPWALGLLGGLLALHAYGLTDALAPGAKPGLLFWLALGLLAAMNRPAVLRETGDGAVAADVA